VLQGDHVFRAQGGDQFALAGVGQMELLSANLDEPTRARFRAIKRLTSQDVLANRATKGPVPAARTR
jgi:hypothetical protein